MPAVGRSPELRAAIEAAAIVPVCRECAKPLNKGLCRNVECRRQVLPRLAAGPIGRDAHSGRYGESAGSLAELAAREAHPPNVERQRQLDRNARAGLKRRTRRKTPQRGARDLVAAIQGAS